MAALCSLAFLTYFDRICISQVQNDITNDLGFNQLTEEDLDTLEKEGLANDAKARAELAVARANERMSWVFIAFLVGYAFLEAPAGWWGDIYGPRAVIFRIVVIWSLFTALTGSSDIIVRWFTSHPSVPLLLGALVFIRLVFGLGEAGAFPNIGRVLARWFPFKDRAFALSFVWASSRLGGAIAPIVTLALSTHLGWRQAFWVLGAVGVAWAALFYWWFRDRPEDMKSVNAGEAELIRSGSGAGSIHEDSGHKNVPWSKILFSTNLWALNLAAVTVSFTWYFNVTFLPQYLKSRFGVEFKDSGWLTGAPLLVGALGCLIGGRLSDYLVGRFHSKKWGRSLQGVIGFGVAGVATLLIPKLSESTHPGSLKPEVIAIIALCIASGFQDLAIPVVWTVTADIGERFAATVGGCMNCVSGVGSILGVYLAPRLAHAYGWNTVFLINGLVYLLGAVMWLRVNAGERLIEDKIES